MPNIKISELSAPIAVTDSDLIPGVQSGVTRRLTWGGLKSTLAGALGRSYLGLGTAAVANVTASSTDTTAGRVLKVGDFGIGTDSQPANIDPNTVRYGSVMGPANQANAPVIECIMWSGGRTGGARAAQFAIDHGSPARSWIRSYNAGRVGSEWGQWVENWTAGNLVKTTSATDTTVGRMLKVGDFGLTADAVSVPDANLITTSGFYRLEGGAGINGPLPGIFFTILSYRYGSTSGGQIATRMGDTSGQTWVRGQQAGVWGAWQQVATSATGLSITVDTGSFGYGTGSGGTVTQATSKATGVTLNKPSGQITTAAGALAANTAVSFTLTNNKIAASDIPKAVIKSGATSGAYVVQVDAVAAGSCRISIRNMTAGSLSETLVLQFNIEKGAIA